MKTVIKLCLTVVFLLCAYSYVDSQTLCTESRCYKLQDELGFYIDSGNPLNVWGVTPGSAALTPCTENRCVKLTDKNGNYIDANNPLPTTTGGGGGGTVTAVTASPPLVSSGGTAPNISANATLAALGAFNSNGCMAQTSVGTFTARTITVGSAKLTISNGNCVSGNPVLDFGSVASTDLSDTTNIMLLNATQSVTGAKSYATNTLKGVDAWLTNGLKDVNGNFVLHTTGVANAVDYLDCQNAATGNPATITCTATGTDSNINIAFVPKGTGSLIAGTGSSTGPLQGGSLVLNGATSGSITQTVAAAVGGSFTITWPGGTTDFTSTGGTSQFVKQASAGGAFAVVRPACADLSDSSVFCTATGATNAQTTTYQVLAADFSNAKTIIVASGTFTITLVASGSQPAVGQRLKIVNYGSGVVTIARSGQNINGGTTSLSLPASSATAPTSATIISDGTNYFADMAVSPAVTTLASLTSANGTTIPASKTLTTTIASGAKALATGAIASAACTTAQTATATGTLTTDVVTASFNGDPTAVTGYVPLTTGMLTIIAYPTADTANFKVCNNTSASITPGAITLNWSVLR